MRKEWLKKINSMFTLILIVLIVACTPTPTSPPTASAESEIHETSSEEQPYQEIIHLNNCEGKADMTTTATRSYGASVQGGISMGVDVKMVNTSLEAKYGENKSVEKSQVLVAPAGTNMEFTISGKETKILGNIITNGKLSGNYTVHYPLTLEVTSKDLGCDNQQSSAPTSNLTPMPEKISTATGTPTVAVTMIVPVNAITTANVNKLDVSATWKFNSPVFAVDLSGNGQWVGVGEKSGLVTIRDLNGTVRQEYAYGDIIYAVKFSPDSRWLAVAGESGKVMIFNTQTWATPIVFDGHSYAIKALAFSKDGAFLISGGLDSKVQIWNVGSWDLRATINMDRRVYALDASPTEDLIVVGKSDGHIGLYNSAGNLLSEVDDTNVPTASIIYMKFSPDGKLLALASSEPSNPFQVWDVQTKKLRREFGEALVAKGLVFSPDGQMLATFTNDKTIAFWRTTTVARIAYYSYHQDAIMAAAFSKDSTLIVTGSYDRTVRFWSVPK